MTSRSPVIARRTACRSFTRGLSPPRKPRDSGVSVDVERSCGAAHCPSTNTVHASSPPARAEPRRCPGTSLTLLGEAEACQDSVLVLDLMSYYLTGEALKSNPRSRVVTAAVHRVSRTLCTGATGTRRQTHGLRLAVPRSRSSLTTDRAVSGKHTASADCSRGDSVEILRFASIRTCSRPVEPIMDICCVAGTTAKTPGMADTVEKLFAPGFLAILRWQ